MPGELARELSEFPFAKLHPQSFRTAIAGLSERDLEKHPIRIWIETEDICKVVKIASSAHILRTYPHLNLVYLETYASELASLVQSQLVRSVWNDEPVKAEGCIVDVVAQADPSARALASRSCGGAR
jgi:hypothetical protein